MTNLTIPIERNVRLLQNPRPDPEIPARLSISFAGILDRLTSMSYSGDVGDSG
jgi:hypothetical protein